jgi:PAS domain S-box-containing protein
VDFVATQPSWFGTKNTQGLADFLAVYESEYSAIEKATLEAAADHPEFGPILKAMPVGVLEAQSRESQERLRLVASGNWEPYDTDLATQGRTYAQMGVSFAGWYDLVRGYNTAVMPMLVERYGSETSRLVDALLAMQAFLDHAMTTIAAAYLVAKQRIIEARERDLEVTLDSIGDAVIATDENGRVVRMNPVAETLTGWRRDEACQRELREVFRIESEDDGTVAENPVQRVLREGVVVGLANHTVLITRDGRRIPIADSAAPIRNDDGAISGVVMVFRDVSEQRTAEDALRASEARKAALIASAIDIRSSTTISPTPSSSRPKADALRSTTPWRRCSPMSISPWKSWWR